MGMLKDIRQAASRQLILACFADFQKLHQIFCFENPEIILPRPLYFLGVPGIHLFHAHTAAGHDVAFFIWQKA